jgi:fibronectin-binding autotransporter adhesin
VLDYNFGQANVAGGPLNDLIEVGGDLALGGTLNVTASGGGSFDPGIYRVIDYAGALSGSLAIGTIPSGTDFYVQTSVANQVNLINTNGLALRFWDGNGTRNDGIVTGGDGVWQNVSGNDNWTLDDASINAPFLDSAFAVFGGVGGTVTVDEDLGAINVAGMQFASDNYVIGGDPIHLAGAPASVIRVGDGTSAGAGFTTTISSELVGASQLVKTDLGTLVLAGTNGYTGGTVVNGGTLRIATDANLGDAVGGLSFDGGTLNTTADIATGRAVDLIGAGTLLTDGGTTLTLGGAVSGAGSLAKDGAGALVLTAANAYIGETLVRAGSLFVNGDQSAATGLTSVLAGATLGGSGVIGGDVALADGATLAAGTNNVGTLTVGGSLALSAGTVLDFAFGEANVAGGSLNDLVNVGGDLTLDGTIQVSVPAGGSFGPGVYRVFNYGGALIDNGLTLGGLPAGSEVSVQTAIAGQINLVNTAGLTLSFWDGTIGPKNNSVVDGGNGVWRVGGGSNNWTDSAGTLNADYAQDSFAIFSATPGTVTVDNGGGAVLASGMQFANGGYVIDGGPLTLTGAQAIVQVGDGSAAGAGYTATIASVLAGAAQLVKTDQGTLVLTGANSYTGGIAIDGGAIRISADANLGDAVGGLTFNGGTLNTTADMTSARAVELAGTGTLRTDAGTTLDLGGAIAGAGGLIKEGAGTLQLSGAGSYAGTTTVVAGTLLVDGDHSAATGATSIASGASLGGTGTIGGNVALADGATLTPGAAGAGTLTINGSLSLAAGSSSPMNSAQPMSRAAR